MGICTQLAPMLYVSFLGLAKYAKEAVERALGRESKNAESAETTSVESAESKGMDI